jgi:hypothetical protein
MASRQGTGVSDPLDQALATVNAEIAVLRSRLAITQELAEHLREIYNICVCEWYDPDNEITEKVASEIWPHIKALNDELKFRR